MSSPIACAVCGYLVSGDLDQKELRSGEVRCARCGSRIVPRPAPSAVENQRPPATGWLTNFDEGDERELTIEEVEIADGYGEGHADNPVRREGSREPASVDKFSEVVPSSSGAAGANEELGRTALREKAAEASTAHLAPSQVATLWFDTPEASASPAAAAESQSKVAAVTAAAPANPLGGGLRDNTRESRTRRGEQAESTAAARRGPPGDPPATPRESRPVRGEPGKPVLGDPGVATKPLFDALTIAGLFAVELEPVALSPGTLISDPQSPRLTRGAPQPPRSPGRRGHRRRSDSFDLEMELSADSEPPSLGTLAARPLERESARARAAGRTGLAGGSGVLKPPSLRVLTGPSVGDTSHDRSGRVTQATVVSLDKGRLVIPLTIRTWIIVGVFAMALLFGAWGVWHSGADAGRGAVPHGSIESSSVGVLELPGPASAAPSWSSPSHAIANSSPAQPVEGVSGAKDAVTPSPAEIPKPADNVPVRSSKGGLSKAAPAKSEPEAPAGPAFDTVAATGALESAARAAAVCRQGDVPPGTATVVVTFAPSGRATSATVSGKPFAGTPTGGCIAAAMRRATVPSFAGQSVTVSKRVIIR